jgi:hypothetical protein
MGHFIALLLLFSTIQNNIHASLHDNYTSAEREEATKIAWVSSDIPHGFNMYVHI